MHERFTRFPFRLLAVVGAVAAVAAVGACSSESVSDRLAEEIIQRSTDEDVDVDFDSDAGRVDVSTPDGSFSFGGGELPADWPSEVPLPKDYEVVSSLELSESGSNVFSVVLQAKRSAQEEFDELADAFLDRGWNELRRSTGSFDGVTTSSASFENSDWNVELGINEGDEGTIVSYTVIQNDD